MDNNTKNTLKNGLSTLKGYNLKEKSFSFTVGVDRGFKEYCRTVFQTLFLDRGIIQQKVADDLGLNKSYLSRIVNGLQIPPLETRLLISKYLNCDSSQLWRIEHLREINKIIQKQGGIKNE